MWECFSLEQMPPRWHRVRQAGQSIIVFPFSSQSSSISGAIFPHLPEPQQTCHFCPQDQQLKCSQTCAWARRTILGDSRSAKGAWALHPHVPLRLGGKCPPCIPTRGRILWSRLEELDLFPVVAPLQQQQVASFCFPSRKGRGR